MSVNINKKFIFIIFLFVLIFSPLAFGTVETWSYTIVQGFSFFAIFWLLLRKLRHKINFFYEIPGIIPLIILSAYIFIQLIPLPPEFVRIVSPGTYNLYRDTILVYDPSSWISLSINKKATLTEFSRITSYVCFYVLTIQLLADRNKLKKTVAVTVVFASVLSFFGILQHIITNNKIYWLRELTQDGTPFGPYVNRNHYAGFMEMMFPLVLSLFLFYKPHVIYRSLREKIAKIFNLNKTNLYILLGFSAVLIATSIFLTLSRSGIVSLSLSMILFGFMFLARGTDKRRGTIIIVIFVLVVLSVGWFGWDPIFERFEKVRNAEGNISELRIEIWKDSKNIIKDFLLTGTGSGSFVYIYPKYRTVSGDATVDHAHNDYIELLSDGGIIAFLICIWFLLTLMYKTYRSFLKRHERYSIYIFIGSITGLISILIHSITDFNLHIGANGLYFFFLAGLAVSAANTRLREGFNDTYLKKIKLPIRFINVPVAGMLFLSLIFNTGIIVGASYFSSVKELKLNEKLSNDDLLLLRDRVYKASLFDPFEAKYKYAIANIEKLFSDNTNAVDYYKKSVRLNPVNGEYLQRLGLVMSELKMYDAADKLLMSGIKYDVKNTAKYKRYALWLISTGKRDEGLRIMKQALFLEPDKTREYITIMILSGLSDEEMLNLLPERVEPHLVFADYLTKTGRDTMAEGIYLQALEYLKNEEKIKPLFFQEIYRYYMKKANYESALEIMKKGVELLPDDAGLRMNIAGLYEKLDKNIMAIEEYKRTLTINPQNKEAKRRLDNLISKIH